VIRTISLACGVLREDNGVTQMREGGGHHWDLALGMDHDKEDQNMRSKTKWSFSIFIIKSTDSKGYKVGNMSGNRSGLSYFLLHHLSELQDQANFLGTNFLMQMLSKFCH